jgi:hypothetical protein
MSESKYGDYIKTINDEIDRDSAQARLVLSYGCKLFKDGDQWCCLLGNNLQEGHGEFSKSPKGSMEKMEVFIYTGNESR